MTEAGSTTNRVYKLAVIPGDGIGKRGGSRGRSGARCGGRRFAIDLRLTDIDFRFLRLLSARHGR